MAEYLMTVGFATMDALTPEEHADIVADVEVMLALRSERVDPVVLDAQAERQDPAR